MRRFELGALANLSFALRRTPVCVKLGKHITTFFRTISLISRWQFVFLNHCKEDLLIRRSTSHICLGLWECRGTSRVRNPNGTASYPYQSSFLIRLETIWHMPFQFLIGWSFPIAVVLPTVKKHVLSANIASSLDQCKLLPLISLRFRPVIFVCRDSGLRLHFFNLFLLNQIFLWHLRVCVPCLHGWQEFDYGWSVRLASIPLLTVRIIST